MCIRQPAAFCASPVRQEVYPSSGAPAAIVSHSEETQRCTRSDEVHERGGACAVVEKFLPCQTPDPIADTGMLTTFRVLIAFIVLAAGAGAVPTPVVDDLVFGDIASEAKHQIQVEK